MRNVTQIRKEIDELTSIKGFLKDPRVRELIDKIKVENEPRLRELYKEMEEVRVLARKPRPRFPDNVPEFVSNVCKDFWRGTTEYHVYRIHCWNDKAVWTSYPSGVWSDNMGQHRSQACFCLVDLTATQECGQRRNVIRREYGRLSAKQMLEMLNEPQTGDGEEGQ